MVNGNLAYKYDYRSEIGYREKYGSSKGNDEKNNGKGASEEEEKPQKRISFPAKLAAVLVLTASAIFMIVQFVEVKETIAVMEERQSQYKFEESVTAQKSFELEQSIDLSKIEQEAVNRLGMQRPDRHQIVYIDVPQDDITEKTAGEVEGFGNRFSEIMKSIAGHIIEFFSI